MSSLTASPSPCPPFSKPAAQVGTPFASATHPITLEATDTRRGFMGFLVNGELVTKERTLTLDALDGVAAYAVEPLYASGTMMIIR